MSHAYRVYCVSRMLFRMNLAMDVRCVPYSVRLAMDFVEGFVLCLQVRRGGWCHWPVVQ